MTLSVLLGLVFFAVVGVLFVWTGLSFDYDLMYYQTIQATGPIEKYNMIGLLILLLTAIFLSKKK
jgi:hypothetical protein